MGQSNNFSGVGCQQQEHIDSFQSQIVVE